MLIVLRPHPPFSTWGGRKRVLLSGTDGTMEMPYDFHEKCTYVRFRWNPDSLEKGKADGGLGERPWSEE